MTLERGTLLHKRYRIVEILGQGGMGSIYRAVDENLGVDVALKENLFTTDEYARQFRLEAVILANLRHPNLPRVSDHFVVGEQGQYLVMDFIEGEDLRQRMERVKMISEDEAIAIGAAICDALMYLHTRKPPILHRDIKPGNVKITPDGHIFLVDFGLAKVVQGSQATTTGARAMTPGYSPPEQYGTARTDPRTDIYSLGATLYAALTGIIPEDGLARAMDNAQLTPLRKRNSKVSRRLAAVIERSMAVDPADRFQTGEEFKKALLGSKSKTQSLPGSYMVEPPPADALYEDDDQDNDVDPPIEKRPQLMAVEPDHEFKPPQKKKQNRIGCGTRIILVGLILLFGALGISYLYPNIVPAAAAPYFPWIQPTPTRTPTSTPKPTETVNPELSPTPTVAPPTATPTKTPVPTATLIPLPTLTPTITLTPSPTPIGGGYGQVAFASDRVGLPQLFIINTDGSDLRQLTNMPEGACQPSWSPDGSKLVFTSPCKIPNAETYRESSLYIINADGTQLTPISAIPGGDFDPAWSPDGTRIAFTSLRDGHRQIYILDVKTMKVTWLINTGKEIEASQPAWSWTGTKIAYTAKRVGALQIWSMSDSGENNEQITRSGQEYRDYLPVWSPDSEYILFNQRPASLVTPPWPWPMQIRYEDRNTQSGVQLKLGVIGIEDIHFSADGFWIVFEGLDGNGNLDIYFTTIQGATRTRLTIDTGKDFDPAWRPIFTP